MLRLSLMAALIGLPTAALAQQTITSKGLASAIATLDALERRCSSYYAINNEHALQLIGLAYNNGKSLFSERYFSDVIGREMFELGKQIEQVGERDWCFETRGQMRQTSKDLFLADAPAQQ